MTVIVDTNLFLLLIVGVADPRYIAKHKRLRAYSIQDFALLRRLLSHAKKILVTPNTMTETSNLASYIAEPARSHILETFRAAFAEARLSEKFVESQIAAKRAEFLRLGLTDAVLLHVAGEPAEILTADYELYLAAVKSGLKAQNFNYLRDI